MTSEASWAKIFEDCAIAQHDFTKSPFFLKADQIKQSCQAFRRTGDKEVRILCKQDSREDRPKAFVDRNLFLLPVRNGEYAILMGEGYVDIPAVATTTEVHQSILDFRLETALVGNSEMQHLDFAYASSLIRTFVGDETLVLTIRGRKYTPAFSFRVGSHRIQVQGVQTEVDAGYEGKNQVVLVEAKNAAATNVIIRQLYYPFRQWGAHTKKEVVTLFFQKTCDAYLLWHFRFADPDNYNSIQLVKSARFRITDRHAPH